MSDVSHCGRKPGRSTSHDDLPAFVPSIDTTEILRRLAADEIRRGRMTRARRRMIERYAVQFGLSVVQAGRLVDNCCKEAIQNNDRTERFCARRLVYRDSLGIVASATFIVALIGVIALDLLLIKWLAG